MLWPEPDAYENVIHLLYAAKRPGTIPEVGDSRGLELDRNRFS